MIYDNINVDGSGSTMLYSLVVVMITQGINSRNPDGSRGSEIYYMGVIDILQRYNINKRAETLFKVR